jgi:enoyl-[acyl-carrier protein] reductase I
MKCARLDVKGRLKGGSDLLGRRRRDDVQFASSHSFVRMARFAAPLMKDAGDVHASYHGTGTVAANYEVRGPYGRNGSLCVLPCV